VTPRLQSPVGMAAPVELQTHEGNGTSESAPVHQGVAAPPVASVAARARRPLGNSASVALRWCVVLFAVACGFHASIASVLTQVKGGDPLTCWLVLPLWTGVAVVGLWRRRLRVVPINDRQVDWVVAVAFVVVLVMVDGLLAARLGPQAQLWRVDLLSVWLFLGGCCVLLFGTRPTLHMRPVSLLLLATWPLPYRLVDASLGGTAATAAWLNVGIGAVAVAIATGGKVRRWMIAAIATLLVGGVLIVMLPRLPPIARETVPTATATLIVGLLSIGLSARRSERSRRPPAVSGFPWISVAIVVLATAVLAFLSPAVPGSLGAGSLPAASSTTAASVTTSSFLHLAGWRFVGEESSSWVSAYFGAGATFERFFELPQGAQAVQPPLSGAIAIDVLTTEHPALLSVYPAVSCYRLTSYPDYVVGRAFSLGSGVRATLFFDSTSLLLRPTDLAWSMLSWTWKVRRDGSVVYQRVDVISPDFEVGFDRLPQMASPAAISLVATGELILRGTYRLPLTPPGRATLQGLLDVSRTLVAIQRPQGAL